MLSGAGDSAHDDLPTPNADFLGQFGSLTPEQREIATTTERKDASQELTVLREQVLEVARARNVVIPASSKGINPTVVTFSDGTTRFYFNDHARYRQAMQARQVPPTRSFPGKPPVPVSRWTREATEQWLAENAD